MRNRLSLSFFLFVIGLLVGYAQRSDERTISDFRQMDIPFYEGNEVRLLTTGPIKFRDMFAEIEKARRFIHMDYFKFQEDSICGVLF